MTAGEFTVDTKILDLGSSVGEKFTQVVFWIGASGGAARPHEVGVPKHPQKVVLLLVDANLDPMSNVQMSFSGTWR
eukprot:1641555-Rhodomonas_salina.1